MGKNKAVIGLLAVMMLAAFTILGCTTTGGGGTPLARFSVVTYFSYPTIYLVANGSVDLTNYWVPVTGEVIKDAVVTVKNETTGLSTVAVWVEPHQAYNTTAEFPHVSGESVSLRIEASGEVLTGGPTVTPNSYVFVTSPLSGATVSVPFTVEWLVSAESYPASHVVLTVYTYTTSEALVTMVPLSTTSYTVTAADISGTGSYYVQVFPVNQMAISNATSDSIGFVGSVNSGPGFPITIE